MKWWLLIYYCNTIATTNNYYSTEEGEEESKKYNTTRKNIYKIHFLKFVSPHAHGATRRYTLLLSLTVLGLYSLDLV